MRLWIVDASPLIFLAKLDRLDLEIDRLGQAGFRVSPSLSEALLREAGETGS